MNRNDFQQTLAKPVMIEGPGLHSGETTHVTLHPAAENTGIVFVCVDAGGQEMPVTPFAVTSTALCTTLHDRISTIEHLMAALAALQVDNVRVEVIGGEIPILDGSSKPWVALIDDAGRVAQKALRRPFVVKEPVEVSEGARFVRLGPPEREGFLTLHLEIDYEHPAFPPETATFVLSEATFRHDIMAARTFCRLRDVETMRAAGLIKGGTAENALIMGEKGVENPALLAYGDGKNGRPSDFIRHKALDAIGDLAVFGRLIVGTYTGHFPGHGLHNALVRRLAEQEEAACAQKDASNT